MATFSNTLRSGLPRVSGGDPWPPEGTVGQAVEWESREWVSAEAGAAEPAGAVDSAGGVDAGAPVDSAGAVESGVAVDSGAVTEVTAAETSTVGSVEPDATGVEPGLDSGVDETVAVEADGGADVEVPAGASTDAGALSDAGASSDAGAQDVAAGAGAGAAVGAGAADSAPAAEVPLRRGLPRVSGGEAWPPEGFAPAGDKAPRQAGGAAAAGAAPAEPGAPIEPGASETGGGEAVVEQTSSTEEASAEEASGQGVAAGAEPTETTSGAEETDAAAVVAGAGAAAGAGVAGAGVAAASAGEDAASVPLRRGLPRRSGGDAWPPEGLAPAGVKGPSASATPPAATAESGTPVAGDQAADSAAATAVPADTVTATDTTSAASAGAGGAAPAAAAPAAGGATTASAAELSDVPLRRGLPRTAGGDPWPPEGFAPATATAPTDAQPKTAPAADATGAADTTDAASTAGVPAAAAGAGVAGAVTAGAAASASGDTAEKGSADTEAAADEPAKPAGRTGLPKTRTGLPKSTGPDTGKPGDKPAGRTGLPKTGGPATKPAEKPAAKTPAAGTVATPAAAGSTAAAATASAGTAAKSTADSTAPKSTTSAKPASDKPASAAPAKRDPIMIGSKSLGQWIGLGSLGLGGLIVAAGILILAARGVTTLPGVPGFLERYPGEYHLPDFVEPGFPAWARWTHFLNFFFMVLIIRTGLQVRHQQKPPAFYTPKNGGKKISINLWLHTSLDVLWLLNGVVFVVLLFVSGHWARIVPTSWEVFPNALSAMLQYMTLEWPMEDAWVNYNSLQQLMYFIVVFIAAPLAAITGVRMSEWWPKNATTLNKIYPAPLARAIHFPTMIFFVFFIAVHVFLVFTTGLRQNLGYMFAGTNVLGWAGVIWFLVAVAVVVGAWFAARPLVLAPIANLFGRVSSR